MKVLLNGETWSCELLPSNECHPIPHFPKYYVLATGHVVSFHGKTPLVLSPGVDAKGYCGVTLRNGRSASRVTRVHRLVAEAFISNPFGLPCVRHLDRNPQNNSCSNLAWGTYIDNENDKIAHGTYDLRKNGKLSVDDRSEILALYRSGQSQKDIANAYSVSRPTINRFINGITWVATNSVVSISSIQNNQAR